MNLFFPMFTMVVLTFLVALIAVKARFSSIKNKTISVKYYLLMQGDDVPEAVTKTTRNFNNLFEVPVLFYVACLLNIILDLHSVITFVAAWLFVVIRYVHSFIHISYNHLLHRMITFWLSLICLFILWGDLFFSQLSM